MQSEDFDKKIRDAAEHHHPAYNEMAWGKMEKMLDEHLPQEKEDKRRILFFLLLFLLIGGGVTALFLWNRDSGKKAVAATESKPSAARNTPTATQPGKPGIGTTAANEAAYSDEVRNTTPSSSSPLTGQPHNGSASSTTQDGTPANNSVNTNNNSSSVRADQKPIPVTDGTIKPDLTAAGISRDNAVANTSRQKAGSKSPVILTQAIKAKKQQETVSRQTPATDAQKETGNLQHLTGKQEQANGNKPPERSTQQPATSIQDPVAGAAGTAISTVATEVKEADKKEELTKAEEPSAPSPGKTVKLKKKKTSYLSLNFSAGPDVSMVPKGKKGKMDLLAGLGIGYTYKNRLTIRTGFYAVNKEYTAKPYDYHAPANFYYYYPNLEKIDANCRVYEIPVSLSYHFNTNDKKGWFVSAGASSYLMKRETYNYFYKMAPMEPTISRERTISGVNKHYFSVLTVSGGYQRNINKFMSLTVEPYMKLPLKGVGYGKVKLNSSGVMFTAGIRPFDISKKGK